MISEETSNDDSIHPDDIYPGDIDTQSFDPSEFAKELCILQKVDVVLDRICALLQRTKWSGIPAQLVSEGKKLRREIPTDPMELVHLLRFIPLNDVQHKRLQEVFDSTKPSIADVSPLEASSVEVSIGFRAHIEQILTHPVATELLH